MKFLIILAALVVEFNARGARPWLKLPWIGRWLAFLAPHTARYAGWRGAWTALIVAGPPLVALTLVLAWLARTSPLLSTLFSFVCLLWALGPDDLERAIADYRMRRSERAPRSEDFGIGHGTLDLGPPRGDATFLALRDALGALAVAAERAWYAPLFWFFVAGPVGCVAYRTCALMAKESAVPAAARAALMQGFEVLDWAPARLSVVGFGLVGTLVPVLEGLRESGLWRVGNSAALIARAALAASDYGRVHDVMDEALALYHLNQTHALLRRTLVVWLVGIALATLLA
jgi:membrane protein required for beta-lactamase induction